MLDFDYKIIKLEDVLSQEEFVNYVKLIHEFDVDLSSVNSSLGFLQWDENVKEKFIKKHREQYDDIFIKKYITYEDFKNLCNLNDEFGFDEKNYFNFFLTCPFIHIDRIGITKYFDIAFKKIIENTFNRKIKENLMRTLVGNINIYPKGSFIKKHQDNDPTNTRLFTSLFFLNHDWDKDYGSILNLYKNDELIEVIPDYKHCILIEHPNYNYVHEVTKNISELNRYSIYQPFTINDLNEILE